LHRRLLGIGLVCGSFCIFHGAAARLESQVRTLRLVREEIKMPEGYWAPRSVIVTPTYTYLVSNHRSPLAIVRPDGSVVERFGRKGRGPGEFDQEGAGIPGAKGDTLWIYDSNLRRMSYFLGSRFIRLHPFPPLPFEKGRWGFPEAMLKDGSMLMAVYSNAVPLGFKQLPGVSSARTKVLFRAKIGADSSKPLALIDSLAAVSLPREKFLRASNGKWAMGMLPVYRESDIVVYDPRGERVVHITDLSIERTPRQYSIHHWSMDHGARTRRIDWKPVPVPAAKNDSAIEKQLTYMKDDWFSSPAETRRQLERAVVTPKLYPPVLSALIDDEGSLWLEKPRADGKRVLERTEGSKTTARVEIPRNLILLATGGGYIWGNEVSDDDEFTFVRYRLES
jgi:hypothetical protein